MVACAAEKHILDGLAAEVNGGFDLLAALDDHRLDGIQACFNDRLDCIQASLDDVLDLFAAFFDNSSRRSCGRGGSRLSRCSPSDSSYSRSCSRHRLNHNLHGVGLGMRSDFNRRNRLFQRKTVRNQLRQVEPVAITAEHQVGHLIQNGER